MLQNLLFSLHFLVEYLLIQSSYDDDFVISFSVEKIERYILFWQWFCARDAQ